MEVTVTKTTSLGLTAAELCSGVPLANVIMEKLRAKCEGKCDGVCYTIAINEIVSNTPPYLSADSGDGSGFVTITYTARTLLYAGSYLAYAPITRVDINSMFSCETPTTIFNSLVRSDMLTGNDTHQAKFTGLHLPLIISASTYVPSRKAQCIVQMLGAPPAITISWGDNTITDEQKEYIATHLAAESAPNKHAEAALGHICGTSAAVAAAKAEPVAKYIAAALAGKPESGMVQMILVPNRPSIKPATVGSAQPKGAPKAAAAPASPKAAAPASPKATASPVTLGFALCRMAEYAHMCVRFCEAVNATIVTAEDYASHKPIWDYYRKL